MSGEIHRLPRSWARTARIPTRSFLRCLRRPRPVTISVLAAFQSPHCHPDLLATAAARRRSRDTRRLDHALPGVVHQRQILRCQREADRLRLARRQVHAVKPAELADRVARGGVGIAQVQLHDLIAGALAGVGHLDLDGQRLVGGNRCLAQPQVVISERRVAQPVAEGVERLAPEVAVGAVRHRVIAERRAGRRPTCRP